jgi:hypothetical protein
MWTPAGFSCWTAATTGEAARFVIPRGGIDAVARGLEAFRDQEIAWLAPYLRGGCMNSGPGTMWKLPTVAVNRLDTWFQPGLQFIGDRRACDVAGGGRSASNLAIRMRLQRPITWCRAPPPGHRHAGRAQRGAAAPRVADTDDATQRAYQMHGQNRVINSNVLRMPGTRKPPWRCGRLDAPMLRRLPAHHRPGVPA